MANYSANVSRNNLGNGSVEFDINILYGGQDVGDVDAVAAGRTRPPGTPEIALTLTPLVAKAGRLITHTLDQYEHDSTHLYAHVTVLFDSVPAWTVEVFAQTDPDPTSPHVYWASVTRIDATQPIQINQTVN